MPIGLPFPACLPSSEACIHHRRAIPFLIPPLMAHYAVKHPSSCHPPKMAARKPKKSVLNVLRPTSWVMLHDTEAFVRLPHERVIYTSPPRTSISLQPLNSTAGSQRFSRSSSSGRVHLTNQRVRSTLFFSHIHTRYLGVGRRGGWRMIVGRKT